MRELGRVTTKVKFAGGLNLLCIAGAGYIFIKTMTKIVEFSNAVKYGELIDTLVKGYSEKDEEAM